MQNKLVFISLGILYSSHTLAVPTLQIHVFDTPEVSVEAKSDSQSILNMHVFDNSKKMQNNAVEQKRYSHPIADNKQKKILSYNKANIHFKTGYRKDNLNWSIPNGNSSPNILSELQWKDIEIATLETGINFAFDTNWLLDVDLMFGNIFDGTNQDSDYLGDNRTLEFSRSNNNADEGSVLDLSAAIGYQWTIPFSQQSHYPNVTFIPQVGLSYNSQNFKMTDGNQTVSDFGFPNPLGPFDGLNSTYDATWFGPWLGLNSLFNYSDRFTIGFNVEYHHANYDSTANWNLRGDFAHPESFTHEATGYGVVTNLEGQWKLDQKLSINLAVKYQDWQANRDGKDITYLSDGSVIDNEFNGVYWDSFGANVGINYQF